MASKSGATCLSAATWRKAKAGGAEHNRAEITGLPGGGIAVRDSKHPERAPRCFTAGEWAAFPHRVLSREL
ncbi:hypothetical protein A6A06_17050 [Streptomyces sp. CB02923]|uniref:DUF397 domain-containing protein n=1 Tax=Streptomyces sp. CB02923 TaxID=1718985 RepID=UPI00093AEBD4|nr:DUF397 domain-containing protein [Streptomyces sp. CB02923]OKI00666.1 hypothetical protein A6A06_17050 [Streptomyces sp. CB02923]